MIKSAPKGSAPAKLVAIIERGEIELNSGFDVDNRRDAALARMLSTPHTPLKSSTDAAPKRRGRPPKPKPAE